MTADIRIAIIAGEVSGDILGGDLVAAVKKTGKTVSLIGVGGDRLQEQGLVSLFDFSELSVMGISEVLFKIPSLLKRIRQTAEAIIAAKPDVLIIIDSPDFTHRVAKRVRAALPHLPVVQYVSPTVWAWKEYRAEAMTAYVDLVLAVLPFEPAVMKRLKGPETVYVGHRLVYDSHILETRRQQVEKKLEGARTVLLLPGSRGSEIKLLAPVLGETARILKDRNPDIQFVLPAVERRKALIEAEIAKWSVDVEWAAGDEFKWQAFARADAAIAASGTVILELALAGIPAMSIYKTDFFIKVLASRIKIWSAALPNLIAGYPLIPEYINELIKPETLARLTERLLGETPQRNAIMVGYAEVWEEMSVDRSPGEAAAQQVLHFLERKKAGS